MVTKVEQVKAIKQELAQRYFDGVCYICGKDHHRKGMTFHHKYYLKTNDVLHSDYPKNSSGNLQYYKDLTPLIRKKPGRFLYLCSIHHQAVERLLRYGDITRKKLYKAVAMSK
jgi:hypothetical protein